MKKDALQLVCSSEQGDMFLSSGFLLLRFSVGGLQEPHDNFDAS